jgi:hypothetical protein
MRTNAVRRAVSAVVVLAAMALLLGNGVVGTTFALFNGETQNANSAFAGGWVGAPSAATATASGYDVALAWTVGTHGPVTGQQLYGVDNTTNSNCTGAAYALLTTTPTTLAAATATYTDPSRGTVSNDGDWYCYEIQSKSATSWTAPFDLAAIQLGLVTTAVQITNNGTANRIQSGDTIKLTFNQRTTVGTGNVRVCVFTNGTILVGDTTAGCTASTDTYTVAKLVVTGATIPTAINFGSSTVTRTTTSPFTMTISLAGSATVANLTGTPTSWKLTGSSSIVSFATTHQATMCSSVAVGNSCQPTTATNF